MQKQRSPRRRSCIIVSSQAIALISSPMSPMLARALLCARHYTCCSMQQSRGGRNRVAVAPALGIAASPPIFVADVADARARLAVRA